jgi:hypothetical protein
VLESQIKQGEMSTSKKTVTNISETNQLRYTTVPLLSTVKENLDNHSNLLPDNETRGGVASRDLSRDKR